MQKLLIFRPYIGDFVFGQRLDGDWVRGYVICVLPFLKLAMIDEAKLVIVSNLATCEKPLSDMYAFTGICKLTDATHRFNVGSTVSNLLLNIMYVKS